MAAVTSRGSVVLSLTKYLVPAEETDCGEYVYRMTLKLKEQKDKKGNIKFKYEGEEDFKIILSALLNTSGGIIQLVPQIPQKPLGDKDFDEWRNSLKDKLNFIPADVYRRSISVRMECGETFVLVNKANEFITVNSHLHSRLEASNEHLLHYNSISQAVSSSTESRSKSTPFTGPFVHGDECPAIENQKLEFKHYKDQSEMDEVDHLIKRLGNGRGLKTLFGMANLPTGGDIVIGIAEDPETKANVYRGQRLSVTQENNFKIKLQELLTKDINGQHIWGFKHAAPEEWKHWSCDFIPLQMPSPPSTPQTRRVLIVIHIFHCPGGAFLDTPEAYSLNDDGDIEKFTYEAWLEMHRMTTINVSEVENGPKQLPSSMLFTSSVQNPSSSVPTFGPGQAAESTKISPDSVFQDNTSFCFTEHSSKWNGGKEEQHPRDKTQLLKGIHSFKVGCPIEYYPSRDILQCVLERFDLSEFLFVVESTVQEPGFGIAADMLWLCLKHSCTKTQQPHRHVMDVLIVTQAARMILAAAVEKCDTSIESCNAYKVRLARVLKRRMLEFLPSEKFMIDCQLRKPDGSIKHCPNFILEWFGSEGVRQEASIRRCQSEESIRRAKHVNFTTEKFGSKGAKKASIRRRQSEGSITRANRVCTNKMQMLRSALANVLKNMNTCFQGLIFRDEDVKLSAVQMDTLKGIDPNRFSVIEGPPGCGKTVLARRFAADKGPDLAAYISASKALTNRAKADQSIRAIYAENSKMILSLLGKELKYVEHIVIDDNHRYSYTQNQLHELCKGISERNQFLHVFQDSKFQNYHSENENKLEKYVLEHIESYGTLFIKSMTTVHRNSQVVSSFMQTQISDLKLASLEVTCASRVKGDNIFVTHINDLRKDAADNGLLKHVQDILEPYITPHHHHYTCRDIGILVDENSTEGDVALFQRILRKYWPVQNAEEFPVRGLIVDTLHNFIGCESRVVLFILARNDNDSQEPRYTEVQKIKHRIAVTSRGIDRVDFLQESNLDGQTAEAMKCDVCPRNALVVKGSARQVPRRMWTKDTARDFTWTAAADSPALVYFTRSGDIIRLVSESGESLPLQIDTAGIQEPRCVDSTPDGAAVLVAHGRGPHWWTVFRRESGVSYRRQATYQLRDQPSGRDIKPTAARWTHDGEIVMVVTDKIPSYHLRKYRVSDGDLLWEVKDVSRYVFPGRLSVCQQSGHILQAVCQQSGHILLADWGGVRVYSLAGELLHRVPLPDRLPDIYSVCAVRKDTWLSGHRDGSVRLWGVSDTARAEHVLVDTGESVWGLALSGDRLLAVRTGYSDKLIVYNVAGCLE